MHQGQYVFSQIMGTVVRYQFNQCVARYRGEHRVRNFSCWEQFLSLSFGQLSFRKSLRDIVVCLTAHREKLYHLGFRSALYLPTLARANERRDWQIYRDYAQILIGEARKLCAHDSLPTLAINEAVYVVDSTTIELCLTLFRWARAQVKQAAIKLHLGLDLRGNIPSFFALSSGKMADVNFLDQIEYEIGAYYIFDRGYIDFERFRKLNEAGAYFITRAKHNWSFRRLYSHAVDKRTGVRSDQTVVQGPQHYPRKYRGKLRRIKFYDSETKRHYVFITNNFELPATVIAELYKQRWQVELFFKWIKQHLSIESFWGRSANAVKTQICIALCAYLLVIILKKKLRVDRNTYEILQILSVSPFDKTPIAKLISEYSLPIPEMPLQKQARLWEF